MKTKSIFFAMALSALTMSALTSCNEEARLASQLPGDWTGKPVNIADNNAMTATLMETITIGEPSSADKTSGQMTVNGVVSATTQLIGDTTFTEPVTVSAGALATVNASWKVVDDDEVIITFDPSSLVVTVDPEAVTVDNALAIPDAPTRIEAMKPGFCEMIKRGVMQTLTPRYSGTRQLDDVKVRKDVMLKFEIGDTDYVFSAVPKE